MEEVFECHNLHAAIKRVEIPKGIGKTKPLFCPVPPLLCPCQRIGGLWITDQDKMLGAKAQGAAPNAFSQVKRPKVK